MREKRRYEAIRQHHTSTSYARSALGSRKRLPRCTMKPSNCVLQYAYVSHMRILPHPPHISFQAAAISAQDASTPPYLPFREPLTTVPATSPIPEPPYTPPVIVTPSKSSHKSAALLRPALRKPTSHHPCHARNARRAKLREGKPRPRAQSLPPALHNTHSRNKTLDHSEAEASGVDDVDVDAEQGGLRRRSLGQRKVQFDKYVSVLEFDSPRALEDASG